MVEEIKSKHDSSINEFFDKMQKRDYDAVVLTGFKDGKYFVESVGMGSRLEIMGCLLGMAIDERQRK